MWFTSKSEETLPSYTDVDKFQKEEKRVTDAIELLREGIIRSVLLEDVVHVNFYPRGDLDGKLWTEHFDALIKEFYTKNVIFEVVQHSKQMLLKNVCVTGKFPLFVGEYSVDVTIKSKDVGFNNVWMSELQKYIYKDEHLDEKVDKERSKSQVSRDEYDLA